MTKFFSADEAGKVWKVRSVSGSQSIASGVTGELVKITAPAGQLVRLHSLSVGNNTQPGMSIGVDGEIVVGVDNINNGTLTMSGFHISRGFVGTSVTSGQNHVSELIGDDITINKNAGNTVESVNYAYEFGVFE